MRIKIKGAAPVEVEERLQTTDCGLQGCWGVR